MVIGSRSHGFRNFTQAGRRARARGLPVLLGRSAVPTPISADLDAWTRALVALLAAADRSGAVDAPSFRNLLLMDAAHLGNNRLGFNFIDEAYLALLVGAQLGEPSHVD